LSPSRGDLFTSREQLWAVPVDSGAMPESNGPYLNYAAVCEKVLREADGVLSLIRIIDHVTVTIVASTPPGVDTLPQLLLPPAPPVGVTLVIGLKSGGFTGSVPVKIRIDTPSGFRWPEYETSADLRGEEQGAAIVLPLQVPAQDEGVYWFVVEVSGEVFTRVPLRISKQVVTQAVPPAQS
jgi:hypothetical protein